MNTQAKISRLFLPRIPIQVEKMEDVAQGRVWAGKDAASRGLGDAIGGLYRPVAIAKLKANIPQDTQVALVELARPSPSLPELLSGIGSTLAGVDQTMKTLLQDLTILMEFKPGWMESCFRDWRNLLMPTPFSL